MEPFAIHLHKPAVRSVPASFGPLKGANANARVTGPCGDTMEFWLTIQDGQILRATFTTDGCGTSIAIGATVARMAEGKTLEEATRLTPQQIETAVGGLPEDHKHCPVLALDTLRAALEQSRGDLVPASRPQPAANTNNKKPEIDNMTTPTVPETVPVVHLPLIGETAPAFKAHTTQGPIDFPKDYEGRWVILFSHPADFTPVCTTEFMTFKKLPKASTEPGSPVADSSPTT